VESDPLLRRVEHTALGLCGAMAVAALIVARGSPGPALAVLAGGLLVGTSYWLLKAGVSNLPGATETGVPRGRIVLSLAGRYALLALMAYVMIARLRLHPLGLLAGASSIVAAVTVEAVRLFVKKS
jgi:ATP synthase I subunit